MHWAWVLAQLEVYAPTKAKDFVPLDKLLINKPPRPPQTWQEIRALMMLAMPKQN